MSRTIVCPHCKNSAAWEHNPYRPFYCERYKLIDLGAWANEDYKLPTEDAAQAEIFPHQP